MRALLPGPGEVTDVHEWYARDWLDDGGLRANFVSSVDGAAVAAGASRGLQTPGDNRIFAALRDLADVVLVGAGTARIEGYRAVRLSEERLAHRQRYDLPKALPIAVVSRSLGIEVSGELFATESPDARTLVITCAAADPVRRAALAEVADVIVAGDDAVDLPVALAALRERGLYRILCEGGPTLFTDLLTVGCVDELCLSITPLLVGPDPHRIVDGLPWADGTQALALAHLLEEDGAMFCRYRLGR